MKQERIETYDWVCFNELVNEYSFSNKKETEKNIKKQLAIHGLGEYRQSRIDYIRHFKDSLIKEIRKINKSEFYQKTDSHYADSADFDIERMIDYFYRSYSSFNRLDLKSFISCAIYWYYLR
jgi:hypothetical protein